MRSIEFFTYLLPSAAGTPSSRKLTQWQAIAWPGAMRVEGSREVRVCPESAEEREALGFNAPAANEPPPARRGRGRQQRPAARAAASLGSR
jgi:hypothetical protein